MGYFSWKTSDTKRSIPCVASGRKTFTVYLLLPDGRRFCEDCYDGYGNFGGRDFFGLVAEINGHGQPEVAAVCLDELTHDGRDVFALLADKQRELDGDYDEKHRGLGLNLCHLTGIKLPKLVENPELKWEDVPDPEPCELQGYFYDD